MERIFSWIYFQEAEIEMGRIELPGGGSRWHSPMTGLVVSVYGDDRDSASEWSAVPARQRNTGQWCLLINRPSLSLAWFMHPFPLVAGSFASF